MARLAASWWRPTWWPYWAGGEPLPYTYNPLIPALIAGLVHGLHWSPALALNRLTAAIYCLGPLTFYLLSWRLSARAGYSFAAALAWSLLSPAQLVMPDAALHWTALWAPTRVQVAFVWDDLPHLTSLALLPLAVWGLERALRHGRMLDYVIAILAMAGMMLSNMFGFVLAALVVITVPLALEPGWRPALLLRAMLTAGLTYAIVSPWLPPSLLLTIRTNETRNREGGWSPQALLALAIVVAVMWSVRKLSARYAAKWGTRWMWLAGAPLILIPALAQYSGWHFLPQPNRYKIEAGLAIAWMAVFALVPVVKRVPRTIGMVLLAVLLVLAAKQTLAFTASADDAMAPADVKRSIEYRSARWVAENLPGQRVMMGGSLGSFLNTFDDVEQLSAQPYTTGPNWDQWIAMYTIYRGQNAGARDAEYSLLWLRAFGAQAIAVPGPRSPEFWKPFNNPEKFEDVLPVLWREDDTTIYRIPEASPSLAHVLRPEQTVHHHPIHGLDVDELRTFDTALDSSPAAQVTRDDVNHVRIRATIHPGEVVSTQITYDAGWNAVVGHGSRPIRADGIGLMVIDPGCVGDCEIDLHYDGGLEVRCCQIASASSLGLLAAIGLGRRRRASQYAQRQRLAPTV